MTQTTNSITYRLPASYDFDDHEQGIPDYVPVDPTRTLTHWTIDDEKREITLYYADARPN